MVEAGTGTVEVTEEEGVGFRRSVLIHRHKSLLVNRHLFHEGVQLLLIVRAEVSNTVQIGTDHGWEIGIPLLDRVEVR